MYGYSLVLMDTTRQVRIGVGDGQTPVNHFAHIREFPDHLFRLVVRPNWDTLYSCAWIEGSSRCRFASSFRAGMSTDRVG